MRPKNQSKFRPDSEKTAPDYQSKTNPKLCQFCNKDPKKLIGSLRLKTRRRRIYAGLYTVEMLRIFTGQILLVCRSCFLEGKRDFSMRPALPPGAAARKRCKIE
jgi:hypothetical protein